MFIIFIVLAPSYLIKYYVGTRITDRSLGLTK